MKDLINSENLRRQSIASSHQCLQNHFIKGVMPYWPGRNSSSSENWKLLQYCFGARQHTEMQQGLGTNKQRYKAADGQTRCKRQQPEWEAPLQEPVLIQPSSNQNGCQRHRATGSLWAASATKQGSDVCGTAAVGAGTATGLLHMWAGVETSICVHPLSSSSCAKANGTASCYRDHARASAQHTKCTCRDAITVTCYFKYCVPLESLSGVAEK